MKGVAAKVSIRDFGGDLGLGLCTLLLLLLGLRRSELSPVVDGVASSVAAVTTIVFLVITAAGAPAGVATGIATIGAVVAVGVLFFLFLSLVSPREGIACAVAGVVVAGVVASSLLLLLGVLDDVV